MVERTSSASMVGPGTGEDGRSGNDMAQVPISCRAGNQLGSRASSG